MQWGPYQFRAHLPDHHIGMRDLKITGAWPTETNSTVEGSTQTVRKTRKAIEVTFTLNYVQKHVNQPLETLALFWQDKIGQIWPMVWGGDRSPNLTPNPMQLVEAPMQIILHKGGTFAVCEIQFKFIEILDAYQKENGWYSSATAIGA